MDQSSSYRDLVEQSKAVLLSPARFWKQIDLEKQTLNQILSSFLLPWLGLTTIVVFIGIMISHPQLPYFEALKSSVIIFARLFFAVYAAAWSFEKINAALGNPIAFSKAFAVVAYTIPILCIESILSAFLPELFWVKVVLLYCIILFYQGCVSVFCFPSKKAIVFALLLFLFMLGFSLSISFLLPIVNQSLL